jgi:hypothetical protein
LEPPIGGFLGDLTHEMADYGPGSHITEFVSAGPKNYAYKFWCGNDGKFDTVCKVKGVTLHYENSGRVNFETIKSIVLEDPPRHVDLIGHAFSTRLRLTQGMSLCLTYSWLQKKPENENFSNVNLILSICQLTAYLTIPVE